MKWRHTSTGPRCDTRPSAERLGARPWPATRCLAIAVLSSAVLAAGCAGGGGATNALKLPSMPSFDPNAVDAPPAVDGPVGSATEVYARVARGALGCWFGPTGGMKKDFVYYADADAPSRGGNAVIVLHKRDPSQPNPRGAKAYRVKITSAPEGKAVVETENLKMQPEVASDLDADVNRWAHGEQGCRTATTAAGWTAGNPPAEADKAAAKSKKKSAKKKATAKKAN